MKISLSWIRDFIDWQQPVPELETLLRRAGLEVAGVQTSGVEIDRVLVVQILESVQHPNADRLSVCHVDDGSGQPRQIVCGAKNYKVGDKVPLALPGAVLPGDFKIKVGKLRGVESEGMLCSAKELRLAEDADGLLILPADSVAGTPLSALYPADSVIELEITPNRPDWLSHLGVAREIAVFSDLALRPPEVPFVQTAPAAEAVRLQAAGCTYYTLRRITGARVGPSPKWLCDRLLAVGLRPINNVVDVTNYVMFELGQPLHAFDAAKISGGIRVREANAGEHFAALDGREHALQPGDLVIADESRVLALAGVMGGMDSAVTAETTDVLLESAIFDPAGVRRTSRRAALITDSSYRFERGVDPEMVAAASARAAALIAELSGGQASGDLLEAGTHWSRHDIELRHDRVRTVLGCDLGDAEIEAALARAGFEQTSSGGESSWSVPGYRREVSREADLIEEVVRVVGIERIEPRAQGLFSAASPADRAYDFAMDLRRALAGHGFHEARTSTLVPATDAAWGGEALALRNPFGEEQSCLRTSLLPGLLAALRRNLDAGTRDIRLFEVGRVFNPTGESSRLALVASGALRPQDWRGDRPRAWDVFDLKGLLEALGRPEPLEVVPANEPPAGFGAAFVVSVRGKVLGHAGLLHPAEGRRLGASESVVIAELDTSAWQEAPAGPAAVRAIPRFPASTRDLACVVPVSLPYADVEAAVASANEPLLAGHTLFDVFTDATGEKLPADRKSLAISLTFRSSERTLTTEEVNAATDRIKDGLKTRLAADFRE